MKTFIVLIFATVATGVIGIITKEKAIPKVTVRLVKKTWTIEGFDPGTDEPLRAFPGKFSEAVKLLQANNKKYDYVAQPLISATNLFNSEHYNASLPSVILTHPMAIGNSLFISDTIGVFALRNLQKNYNIFAMHAPWLSAQFQTSCARVILGLDPLFKPVAEAFATFLLDGIALGKLTPSQINFIGFSYSATLNAYIAREIRDNTGLLTHTLMTLDAFQYNHNNPFFTPVSKDDAQFVHMFHSSTSFGTPERKGTVNIVINNGIVQPGCKEMNIGCSHRRSVLVFFTSVLATGRVVARQCKSWEKFDSCRCKNKPLLVVTFPVNEEARGTFYVRTGSLLPWGLGLKGARGRHCKTKARKIKPLLKIKPNM
ncbi:phospholipase A1-like [Macrosteles quadrilineatus]|uniref:phospholipase A1-like n=1 Tax=Macrosteles quadrilineatus TaxID=74068 RepID=UPI0023E3171B|nr:phospholipase A1-like [Macrosteles quadrilineatus]